MQAANGNPIDKILLTASGGPFFGKKIEEMRGMTREQALAHPNWKIAECSESTGRMRTPYCLSLIHILNV